MHLLKSLSLITLSLGSISVSALALPSTAKNTINSPDEGLVLREAGEESSQSDAGTDFAPISIGIALGLGPFFKKVKRADEDRKLGVHIESRSDESTDEDDTLGGLLDGILSVAGEKRGDADTGVVIDGFIDGEDASIIL